MQSSFDILYCTNKIPRVLFTAHRTRLLLSITFAALLLAQTGCGILQDTSVTIRWTTESELDIIGFNLFRAESPDGPFIKVNEALIPPAADPFVGGEHTYVDENVQRGVTYYYELESVDRQGSTTRTGPITITAGG
jgi:hypothetical protein